MKRKILSIFTILLVATMITSTASAGGNVGLSGAQFFLGSITAMAKITGLGGYSDGVTAYLSASGTPVVTCTNQGGNQASGQNPTKVSADGIQEIPFTLITKKGTAPLDVTAEPDLISGKQGGCPNNNWKAEVEFVYWTNATISIVDNVSGAVLFEQHYTCITTRNPDSVSCTPVE